MKKKSTAIFCFILLFAMSTTSTVVNATSTTYIVTNNLASNTPVLDGAWTSSDEWTDLTIPPYQQTAFNWREKWAYPGNIYEYVLIEVFSSTNDTGDIVQYCLDRSANNGASPATDDTKIEITGNKESSLKVYAGGASGWTEVTGLGSSVVSVKISTNTSPLSSTPHFIYELMMDRSNTNFDTSGSSYQPGIRVSSYDASTTTLSSWPPSTTDTNPSGWGTEVGSMDPVPESLTFMTVLALSSFAIIGSVFLLKKHNVKALKTEIISPN